MSKRKDDIYRDPAEDQLEAPVEGGGGGVHVLAGRVLVAHRGRAGALLGHEPFISITIAKKDIHLSTSSLDGE